MVHDCIFCLIINNQVGSTKIFENEHVLVIKDIHPKAPIHYLILPKKHVEDFRDFTQEEKDLLAELMLTANKLSQSLHNKDYRLIINNGYSAGQRVFHSHIHFLAGKEMSEIV